MSAALAAIAPYMEGLAAQADRIAADLDHYVALLGKWNAVQNLVSRETLNEVWPRHIADSLQVLRWMAPRDRTVLDIGSGGGFPALPLAIASRGLERRFTLLEPVAKKASFLRTVARELELAVTVENCRAADFDSRETVDLVTARALTALPRLLGHALPFFAPHTRGLFHKGREYQSELADAAQLLAFDVLIHRSATESSGVLLEISNLRAKSAA